MDRMKMVKLVIAVQNMQEDLTYLATESNIKDRYALDLLNKVNVQATKLELLIREF